MQGTWFDPWSRKIPHAMGQLSLCTRTAEPMQLLKDGCPRAYAPLQEKPPQGEAHALQLERTCAEQWRPSPVKTK